TKYGKLLVAKNQLRDAGDIRKLAKGHWTTRKLASEDAPRIAAWAERVSVVMRRRTTSKTMAGTIMSKGKSGGTRCVILWYTGPSLGSAGISSRIHMNPRC